MPTRSLAFPRASSLRFSQHVRPLALAVALVCLAPALRVGEHTPVASAQSGLVCPSGGPVILSYNGDIYTGAAVRTEGMGMEATYEFVAYNSDGHRVTGTASAHLIDCLASSDDGLVTMGNVKITGYSTGVDDDIV